MAEKTLTFIFVLRFKAPLRFEYITLTMSIRQFKNPIWRVVKVSVKPSLYSSCFLRGLCALRVKYPQEMDGELQLTPTLSVVTKRAASTIKIIFRPPKTMPSLRSYVIILDMCTCT